MEKIISGITGINKEILQKAKERTAKLALPPRALGKLHDCGERLCAILGTLEPNLKKRRVFVMAGDHGVAVEGVSAFPQSVTGEMVRNFIRGGATINVLAAQVPADVVVVDMGIIPEFSEQAGLLIRKIRKGTDNMARGPAMSKQEAEQSIKTGFDLASDAFGQGVELIATGDMGIANTTPSAAIGAAILGIDIEKATGRGSGVDAAGFRNKCGVIRRSIEANRPDQSDGLDVLAKVGGFEIGGIAGLVLAAAYHKRPVVIDGFISTAGALIAHTLNPLVSEYIFAGHKSRESGHALMLSHMGLEPILDLDLRLGEGTGAVLAMHILEAARRVFREVLTFEQAEVSEKS